MKPQIRISLDVEDHDRPLLAAKLEQIALLLREKARS